MKTHLYAPLVLIFAALSVGCDREPAPPSRTPKPAPAPEPEKKAETPPEELDPLAAAAKKAQVIHKNPYQVPPGDLPPKIKGIAGDGYRRRGFAHTVGDPLWDKFANAEMDWRGAIGNLIIEKNPKLIDIEMAIRKREHVRLDLMAARFAWLRTYRPEGIIRDQGVGPFINLNWTDRDEDLASRYNRDLLLREAAYDTLRQELEQHPLYKTRMEVFRKEVVESSGYEEAEKAYKAKLAEIEASLKSAGPAPTPAPSPAAAPTDKPADKQGDKPEP